MFKQSIVSAAAVLLAGIWGWTVWSPDSPNLGQGDVRTLETVIAKWSKGHEAQGGAAHLQIDLTAAQQLSGSGQARGSVRLDLSTGQLTTQVRQLAAGQSYTLNMTGGQPRIERLLGQFVTDNQGNATWQTRLNRNDLQGITLDGLTVTRSDAAIDHTVLAGSPSFLQRYYYSDKPWSIARFDRDVRPEQPAYAFLLPKVALAHGSATLSLAEKIAKGRDLFVNETFNGNGRTCATCHRPDNNHTIDPAYIAKLPANDPLFVAETKPELAELENPKLLRQFALILANVDGFDKPPVFRSVPHTLGLGTSLSPEFIDTLGAAHDDETGEHTHDDDTPYDLPASNHMIGWSGDGAPGNGSLRMFAKGAIIQHAPKSLNRIEGIDFRLPTEDELDAMEAYMLSLGRSADINLAKMHFNSPLVETGKTLFNSDFDDASGKCKGCHVNAGANSSFTTLNGNRNSGVENLDLHPARLVEPDIAFDGGFGKDKHDNCGPSKNQTCYGDGRFNISSLVEAADTPPYFHNNAVTTLEEAIAMYNSTAFNQSPGAIEETNKKPRAINLDSSKVVAIASFLRAINALENIRNANRLDERAMTEKGKTAKETVRLAMADTQDAIDVLQQGYNLYPDALRLLEAALQLEKKGGDKALKQAIAKKQEAKVLIVKENP